ncbi:hypothetical protein EYZ11_008620 [Aspergillus tanneri]|uniref:Uncharacterized protein n=1 Tax=Aspergillus tanneri TaxID=1220188 RepID=A0A4S3JA60_9EURO|nr:hypothetical protein EYZ11_008620 [Aspergillus tanneri]
MACRLPGHSNSPRKLWEFLMRGEVAWTEVPKSRFNIKAFYDGSDKPGTLRSSGAMFMESVNPAVFDASFFNISPQEAISMDPQQRILLEVIYEGLEHAGLALESLAGEKYGCFVGGYTGDHRELLARDPDSSPSNVGIGCSGAMLSNRISHFLDIKGPSMPVDTACSSSIVALEIACKFLHTGEINGAIVAASNLVLDPGYGCDSGPIKNTHSPTGRCHTFDAKADGYVKAEGISAVILKRFDDAIQDGDPIRAVIRGTASNHNGRTPGIASPSAEAQAAAIQMAYSNANITDYSLTGYLECHGTGTLAGDPVEARGISSVFSASRPFDKPLHIGSIKSNIGHSETAAGLSGLIKAIMVLETGQIPGNPTFENPSPKIDFQALRLKVQKNAIPFPNMPFRRVGVNNFGFGGSNSHVILEEPKALIDGYRPVHTSSYDPAVENSIPADDHNCHQSYILCFSANDERSLKRYIERISQHFGDPNVHAKLRDVAYTLNMRRSHLFHRGYLITKQSHNLNFASVVYGKRNIYPPRLGFVFTGQGAQWPEMGRELLEAFPAARMCVENLDIILQALPDPPSWSLYDELIQPRTPEHTRKPEFSQPLVTALQMALIVVLGSWRISPKSVVGHSSGEIAAAYAAGYVTDAEAIIIAYHRGLAAHEGRQNDSAPLGMLAVGLGAEKILPYLSEFGEVQIACYNSPTSVTLSGVASALEQLKERLTKDGVFARMLQVDLAYHSNYMHDIGEVYERLLSRDLPSQSRQFPASNSVTMVSSVTGCKQETPPDITYWKTNMTSPVRFADAIRTMLSTKDSVDFLIEIGPSGALKGPISQIQSNLCGAATSTTYHAALHRDAASTHSTLAIAGELFLAGLPINLEKVNEDTQHSPPLVVIDLPNYCWNHSTQYWHESQASKDWRFKPFTHHDLIGSKILGTPWSNPTFKKTLNLAHLPWLRDHKIGSDVVFPASGYIAMAVEAMYQVSCMQQPDIAATSHELGYRLRNIRFDIALVLDDEVDSVIYLAMNPSSGANRTWYEFTVSSSRENVTTTHASGMICLQEPIMDHASETDITPLQHSSPGHLWTKACAELGYNYGPAFHILEQVEARAGKRYARSLITLTDPPSAYEPQSSYPFHPAALDGAFRATMPSFFADSSKVCEVLIPAMVDDMVINPNQARHHVGMAVASCKYSGRGRKDTGKSYLGNVSVYDPTSGALLIRVTGLSNHQIDLGIDPLSRHTLTQDIIKPDISTLSQESINKLSYGHREMIPLLLELAVHKKPSLKVLEVDLDSGGLYSLWLEFLQVSGAAHQQYCFKALDEVLITDIKGLYEDKTNCSFGVIDREGSRLGFAEEDIFDLVILKGISPLTNKSSLVVDAVRGLVSPDGHVIVIDHSAPGRVIAPRYSLGGKIKELAFSKVLSVPHQQSKVLLCSPSGGLSATEKELHVVYFEETTRFPLVTQKYLEQKGWHVIEHKCPSEDVPAGATVLIIDEKFEPVLTHVSKVQWLCLRRLVTRSYMHSLDDSHLAHCIAVVLGQLQRPQDRWISDSEYVEYNGILHVHRIVPYCPLNHEVKSWMKEPVIKCLSSNEAMTQLRAEKIGTLDGLHFAEVSNDPPPEGHVEIEVKAVGLNFKDVAVAMGIVPENEYLLGLEGSGIIRRVSAHVDHSIIDNRVVFMAKGAVANRIHVPLEFTHTIPDVMSYEEAATIPVVFCTALYALCDMGNLRRGQTVLIHSAAGGVGIACIQLAQYIGADIYVTVSTEEKRSFLHKTFGIPYEHMSSSRCPKFAAEIMKATNGKGIDVIVNSLTGDLLDATWRICSDGGIMVELGKRDIVQRNYLSMEPFDRGCSFRAVDLSHGELLQKVPGLLKRIFALQAENHIRPIAPITTFSMTQTPEAFAYIRSGRHIGKVVIRDEVEMAEQKVPMRSLRKDLSFHDGLAYFIVGGLKGLCGSLAKHLAHRGARHLVVMSRSGCTDSRSQKVMAHCQSLGCEVHICRGDVSRILDVRRAFMTAPAPIGGIVQGVMALRDRPYEMMTVEEYHQSIEGKVQGTWNLHHVSVENGRRLDFFLLLSSISSVVGSPGQANYSAANSFLDSFAVYRRSMGLAAQTVNLGVVEDVGAVAESQDLLQRHQASNELIGIPDRVLHCILDCSLRHQYLTTLTSDSHHPKHKRPCRLITGLKVPQDPAKSGLRFDPRFQGLFIANDVSSDSETGRNGTDDIGTAVQSFRARVCSGATAEELLELCLQILTARLVQMLRRSAEQWIEPGQPLSVYGLDSLSTVELRNWIKAEMGAKVTTFDILSANSLIMLGERLVNKLRRE